MQRPKGTKDVFGEVIQMKSLVEQTLTHLSIVNNFSKIETPIFERKEVFVKSVGETSDIVKKEMYEFEDKKGREMVLRPEGTAAVMRAVVENKLYAQPLPLKLFYEGAMFRYENPQRGRQRQFTTYGVEVLSDKSALIDAEVIIFAKTILDAFKIKYNLVINSLGDKTTRDNYSKELKKYFEKYKKDLEPISVERLNTNPMRILDDKIESKKDFVKKAPKIEEFYSKEDKEYFGIIQDTLSALGIEFKVDHSLVRGLDYYSDIAFEFVSVSDKSGSQDTIIGGGRYNSLLKSFGGPDVSGVGFGVGIERLINEIDIKDIQDLIKPSIDVFVSNIDPATSKACLGVVYSLRSAGISTDWNYKPAKLIKTFEKADKLNARLIVICGPKELEKGMVIIKRNKVQHEVKIEDIIEHTQKMLGEINE